VQNSYLTKVIITSIFCFSGATLASESFDFRTDFTKTSYVGGNLGYVMYQDVQNSYATKSLPLAINAFYGRKFVITDRFFYGFEVRGAYLGNRQYVIASESITQNIFEFSALVTFTGFLNPYFELHAKVGPAYQYTLGSTQNTSGLNALFEVGAGLYVTNNIQLTTDITILTGSKEADKAQGLNTLNIGINYYF
jgi:hypothetical protein